MFKLTIVTWREHILLTSGFCHSIAHSFSYLETTIQVCDTTRTLMRSQNMCRVDHQSSDTNMNYRIGVYFCSTNYQTDPKRCGTALYTLNKSFKYFCRMYMKLCQVSLVSLVILSLSVVVSLSYYDMGICAYLYCRFQAKITKVKPSYVL